MEKDINNINKELREICLELGIPIEKDAVIVGKDKQEVIKPIIFPAEGNLNKLGIFALSRPRKKYAITERHTEVNSTGESYIVEIRHPGDRMLGYPELKVWLIFQYLYNEQMFQNKDEFIKNDRKIPFAYAQICRLLQIGTDGTNPGRVKKIIENLEDTKIIIKEFYNKEKGKIEITERFNIFSHSWNVRVKYNKKDKRDYHWVRIDTELMKNIDSKYITTFNLDRLMSLKQPIALGLYLKLTSVFYGSPIVPLYYKYSTLCFYCQLPIRKENLRIETQFEPAFNELVKIKFLDKYKWKDENKKHIGVNFWPGELYYAERKIRQLKLT